MKAYSKEVYTKEVLLKSAYSFTDECYIHIDADNDNFLVELELKDGSTSLDLFSRFENELIAQETRRIVSEQTKNIRELIVARSLSSTIVNKGVDAVNDTDEYDANDILTDWFDKNE